MKPLTVGGKTYHLHHTTGTVQEAGKNMETKVTGSGGGGFTYGGYGGTSNVNIRSHTTVHDQLFLTDKEGGEHAFQLQNFNVACRQGHLISVIWAIKDRKKKGKYIAVVNHSTRANFYDETALKNVFRFNIWYFLGGGFVLGWLMGGNMAFGIPGLLFGIIAWVFVLDFGKLKQFKASVAEEVLK